MVAYSFKSFFAPKILDGTKRQTIRAVGRRRHALPGEEIQLYTGLRTQWCKLIARATCEDARGIDIEFDVAADIARIYLGLSLGIKGNRSVFSERPDLDRFAMSDGFNDWHEMRQFMIKHHGDKKVRRMKFEGVLITWKPIVRTGGLTVDEEDSDGDFENDEDLYSGEDIDGPS